jgi:hypothetical protein
MNGIFVYQTPSGWIYEVRCLGCPIAIGCCATPGRSPPRASRTQAKT